MSEPNVDSRVADYLDKEETRKTLARSALAENKAAIFHSLAAAAITTVVVHFDGSGDSGQIEDIDVQGAADRVALPDGPIEIASADWGALELHRTPLSPSDAIEQVVYDLLEQTYGGWENNEGAYGDFTFDVAEQLITLDFNARSETSENYRHVF